MFGKLTLPNSASCLALATCTTKKVSLDDGGLDGAFMDLYRVDTHYIMTRRHYSPPREGDNVVRLQLMPQVSAKLHCSLYTRQPSRIITIATVGRVS